ncbi:precorrin-3B synthase [Labrys monachus]|uniref:Precorrin-3B synthase n=1 Tax=Labrys monachus TaxID=217067 RepID=A0ABU0FD09_9HYPH|nr:precorrin-3B synthase [Labrys monachus]MDQ0392497.1 precorrin-3B synthase [Labrys monachus]
MSAPLRKGWCPGALRPMRTGDGLLVRVRLTGGALPAGTARALAQAARDFGNGLFDLSARANLQMRGVSDDTLPPLLDRLSALGVLDADEAAEQVRNVLASPLAGLDPMALIDVTALTRRLEGRLTADPALHALPPKFGFLVDGGGALRLDGVEADIGLRAADADVFRLTAGHATLGFVAPENAIEAALDVARAFLRHRRPDERRMRDLVKRLQDEACETPLPGRERGGGEGGVLEELSPASRFIRPGLAPQPSPEPGEGRAPLLAGCKLFGDGHASGFFAAAAPFGRLDADQLAGLATLAEKQGTALRLSPWRAIILAPVPAGEAASLGTAIASLGLVVDDTDPRLAIAACPGSPSCLSGQASAQADAARLAPVFAPFIRAGASVHVSGCAKGCARRAPASIVLVGQGGRYGLAFDADSRAPSETAPMDIGEIAALLKRRVAANGAKKNSAERDSP